MLPGGASWPWGGCDRPLPLFLAVCAPIFFPYGLVISGLYQEDRGRRLLWFLRSKPLTRAVACTVALALVWCILGAVWLFRDADRCRERSPEAYYSAVASWAVLAALNLPLLAFLALPCMLCCRCPAAFSLLSFASGVGRAVVDVEPDDAVVGADADGTPKRPTLPPPSCRASASVARASPFRSPRRGRGGETSGEGTPSWRAPASPTRVPDARGASAQG